MKLKHGLLRARRLELGLTSREVAREATVSNQLVKRLEDTGDASVLQVGTLAAILNSLSLDLVEALERPTTTGSALDETVKGIAGLLLESSARVPLVELALTLSIDLEAVEPALDVLEERLRSTGLRISSSRAGVSIVPAVRPEAGSGSARERTRHLTKINHGDLVLLHRVVTGRRVLANSVTGTTNGIALRRLEGAGLARTVDGELQLTELVTEALFG